MAAVALVAALAMASAEQWQQWVRQTSTKKTTIGGCQKSINNHTTMTAGNNKQQERAADDEGSNKEGKGDKGDGDYNEGGVQQRG